jgi:hypothetical protein
MHRSTLSILLVAVILTAVLASCGGMKDASVPGPTPAPGQAVAPSLPAPKGSPEEITSYSATLLPRIAALGQAMQDYNALLRDPKIGDEDWQTRMAAQGDGVDVAYQELVTVKAAAALAGFHAAVANGATGCKQARDDATAAIATKDQAALARAADLGAGCLNKLEQAQAALQAYADSHNLKLPVVLNGGSGSNTWTSPLRSTVNDEANLRRGPGTDYPAVGQVTKGMPVTVIGRNEAGDWLVVESELVPQAWIAAFLVDNPPDIPSLPVVRPPPV